MQANPHYARVIGTRVYSDVSILIYAALSIHVGVYIYTHTYIYISLCIHIHLSVYMYTYIENKETDSLLTYIVSEELIISNTEK